MKRSLLVALCVLASLAGQSSERLVASGWSQPPIPVTLRLLINQKPATVTVLDGGMARVTLRDQGSYGLVPRVSGDEAVVSIVEIIATGDGAELQRETETVYVTIGHVSEARLGPLPIEIALVRIGSAQPSAPVPDGPCLTCCVTCDEQTVCGCFVDLGCARCCCPAGGCGCIPDGPNAGTCSGAVRRPSATSQK